MKWHDLCYFLYISCKIPIIIIISYFLFLFFAWMSGFRVHFCKIWESMGRGVSSGGGQSSLGYLFGSGEAPKPAATNAEVAPNEVQPVNNAPASKPAPAPAPASASPPVDVAKQVPAGINSTSSNNYMRADGQNTGNFITVWLYHVSLLFSPCNKGKWFITQIGVMSINFCSTCFGDSNLEMLCV
jgi:SPIRAL1-like protein